MPHDGTPSWRGRHDGRRCSRARPCNLHVGRCGILTRCRKNDENNREPGREYIATDEHARVLATAKGTTATRMLVLGSLPCESFRIEFRNPSEWPTSAHHHELHRTGFPSIGEPWDLCACVLAAWPKAFTPEVIAVHGKAPVWNSVGTDRTCPVMTCGSSIVERFFGTIA
jgi:hypothetical protein